MKSFKSIALVFAAAVITLGVSAQAATNAKTAPAKTTNKTVTATNPKAKTAQVKPATAANKTVAPAPKGK